MEKRLIMLRTSVLSILLAMGACVALAADGPVVKHDTRIERSLRTTIQRLNDQVIAAIRSNKPDTALGMGSEPMVKEAASVRTSFKELSQLKDLADLKLMDEYHIKLPKDYKNETPYSTSESEDPFEIAPVSTTSREIYVSMFKTTGPSFQYLLSFVYIKEKSSWKLHNFACSDFSFMGQDTMDLYEISKKSGKEGYHLTSFLYMNFASNLARPAPYIQYKKEAEMITHLRNEQQKLFELVKLPKTIDEVQGKPAIFGISITNTDKDLIPIIKYKSTLPLDKKDGLVAEVQQMMPIVDKLYPGTASSFKQICFQAYSEIPSDPKVEYKFFNIMININHK